MSRRILKRLKLGSPQCTAAISRRRMGQHGSAIVESALVMLATLALIIGAVDFGQFLFVHQALVERARSAARWGAINDPKDTVSIKNMVLYNQKDALDVPGYFGLDASMIEVSVSGEYTDDYRLNVLITNYPYQIVSPYIAGTYRGPIILMTVPIGL
ncbi:MAG: pilus assembly protein [Acidobacteria bacterium]|nr:pilus assembly protein [Acidobacteriota bacterium]